MRTSLLLSAAVLLSSCTTPPPPTAGATGAVRDIYQPGRLRPTDSVLRVKVGDPAPGFDLPAVQGGRVRLQSFQGRKNVVLTFVPAAFTPVCSAQWPGYALVSDLFAKHDAVLIGITTDNIPSLHAWTREMGGLPFPVLSDFWPHGATAARYGLLRTNGTTERALVVIDKKGLIRWIDVHDINQRPPLEDLAQALEGL